jgi:hypothetical protein
VVLIVASLMMGPVALAHEGHPHTIMGTVSVVHGHSLDLKASDGRSFTFVVDEKTKISHDKMPMTLADIKGGDRVVVTASEKKDSGGKLIWTALQIRLGTAPAPGSRK